MEMLHWIQVMELAQMYYSAARGSCDSQDRYSNGAKTESLWEDIAAEAFFSLCISVSMKETFLSQSDRGRHDEALLETLESLLLLQNASDTKETVSITFSDFVSSTGLVAMVSVNSSCVVLLRCYVSLIHNSLANRTQPPTKTKGFVHCNIPSVSYVARDFCSWKMMRQIGTFC